MFKTIKEQGVDDMASDISEVIWSKK